MERLTLTPNQAASSINYVELPLLVRGHEVEEHGVVMMQCNNCVGMFIYTPADDFQVTANKCFISVLTIWFNPLDY